MYETNLILHDARYLFHHAMLERDSFSIVCFILGVWRSFFGSHIRTILYYLVPSTRPNHIQKCLSSRSSFSLSWHCRSSPWMLCPVVVRFVPSDRRLHNRYIYLVPRSSLEPLRRRRSKSRLEQRHWLVGVVSTQLLPIPIWH